MRDAARTTITTAAMVLLAVTAGSWAVPGAAPAAAQTAPPKPRPAEAGPAPGNDASPAPAAKPHAAKPSAHGVGDSAPPPGRTHRPGAVGRLIPPDEMPPAPTDAPAGAGTTAPAARDGDTALTLNPDGQPATDLPEGPPMREQLRETALGFAICRATLSLMGARYSVDAPVMPAEDRDCGIARPVTVHEIQPGVTLEGGAQMRCGTALALASWVRDVVEPAARHLPGAPRLTAMTLGTTYQCRPVVGGASKSRLSEHAFGNAIDIAGFRFADGSELPVQPRQESGDIQMAFQAAVQAGACLDFTTVLGPGSNAAHDDHLHLDIKARRGGYRLCQ